MSESSDPRSAPTTKDGFRKRRKRPKGWLKQAIKEGSIADPHVVANTETSPPGGHVVSVPTVTIDLMREE